MLRPANTRGIWFQDYPTLRCRTGDRKSGSAFRRAQLPLAALDVGDRRAPSSDVIIERHSEGGVASFREDSENVSAVRREAIYVNGQPTTPLGVTAGEDVG